MRQLRGSNLRYHRSTVPWILLALSLLSSCKPIKEVVATHQKISPNQVQPEILRTKVYLERFAVDKISTVPMDIFGVKKLKISFSTRHSKLPTRPTFFYEYRITSSTKKEILGRTYENSFETTPFKEASVLRLRLCQQVRLQNQKNCSSWSVGYPIEGQPQKLSDKHIDLLRKIQEYDNLKKQNREIADEIYYEALPNYCTNPAIKRATKSQTERVCKNQMELHPAEILLQLNSIELNAIAEIQQKTQALKNKNAHDFNGKTPGKHDKESQSGFTHDNHSVNHENNNHEHEPSLSIGGF